MTVTVEDHPLVRARILTWEPMQAGQPYLALIEGASTVLFKGASAFKVYKQADDWRKEQAKQFLKQPLVFARVERAKSERDKQT